MEKQEQIIVNIREFVHCCIKKVKLIFGFIVIHEMLKAMISVEMIDEDKN